MQDCYSELTEHPFITLHSGSARHRSPQSLVIPSLKHYLIRIQLEGTAHAHIDNQYVLMKPGHLLILSPGEYYDLKIGYRDPELLEPHKTIHSLDYYMIINGPWIERWWNKNRPPFLTYHAIDDRILSIWREIIQELRISHSNMNDITKHLTYVLFLMFERALAQPIQKHSRNFQTAQVMKQYIEQHATESFTVQEIADHVKLSPSRAAHVFKEEYQQSIMDYVIELRLSMACERIHHGYMTLEQIAELCGFRSYSYFHRTFRNRFGLSPSQFRDQRQLADHL